MTRGLPIHAAAVALALGLAAVLYLFSPEDPANRFYPRCPLNVLTGLQCAGCGTTRALHHLLHGEMGEAWARNAGLFVTLPATAVLALAQVRLGRRGKVVHPVWVLLIAFWLVLYTIVRNLG